MLYTWLGLASPVAVCTAIRGRYTRLAWLARPNPNPVTLILLTLHTASRVTIRLAMCIDTFIYFHEFLVGGISVYARTDRLTDTQTD